VRTRIVVLSVLALGVAYSMPASAASHRASADEKVMARIMALAENDLQLRRADLGLVGSTLAGISSAPTVPLEEMKRAESSPASGQAQPEEEAPPAPTPVLNR
jgi:hypothetical protein